jgi:sensor c-di-GMP phosphodiesterase-like protein
VTWLRNKGVQYGQGWYYSKALSATELAKWLGKHRAPREADSMPANLS